MNMTINGWSEQDLPEMLKIWNAIVTKGEAFPQEEQLDPTSGKKFFQSQSFCGVIKEGTDSQISGLYILHPNNVGRCGHICNASYAVAENARGRGLGKFLVKHSLETAKKLGFRIMQFNAVVKDNMAAHKLYRKLGFKSLGMIPGGFKNLANEYKDICLYYYDLAS